LIGSVMFAMLLSLTFLLPVFMQEMLGFTAVQTGVALMPRALTMMVMMPIVGRLYNKVSPRMTVAFGVLLFVLTASIMSRYTLQTTTRDVVLVLVLQGIAFSCLFIPLTTVALANIPRHNLADATGLNSLLRQIGGSIGLAAFASLIPHFDQAARIGLISHLGVTRPEVAARLARLSAFLQGRGYSAEDAHQAAGRMLGGMVQRQAAVLSFEKLFLLAGIVFLVVLPLLIFLKSKPAQRPLELDAHAEI
jgi:DHA2 family multidrug resistance protein